MSNSTNLFLRMKKMQRDVCVVVYVRAKDGAEENDSARQEKHKHVQLTLTFQHHLHVQR